MIRSKALSRLSFSGVEASRWLQKFSIKIGRGWGERGRELCLTSDLRGSIIKQYIMFIFETKKKRDEGGGGGRKAENNTSLFRGGQSAQSGRQGPPPLRLVFMQSKANHLLVAAKRTDRRIHLVAYLRQKSVANFPKKFQTVFFF